MGERVTERAAALLVEEARLVRESCQVGVHDWACADCVDKETCAPRKHHEVLLSTATELRASSTTAPWIEEELKDGDRICEAAGVKRTEGGRLPVAKIINKLRGRCACGVAPQGDCCCGSAPTDGGAKNG